VRDRYHGHASACKINDSAISRKRHFANIPVKRAALAQTSPGRHQIRGGIQNCNKYGVKLSGPMGGKNSALNGAFLHRLVAEGTIPRESFFAVNPPSSTNFASRRS
jgi:hypothetical protein